MVKRFKAYFLLRMARFHIMMSGYHIDRARACHDKVEKILE